MLQGDHLIRLFTWLFTRYPMLPELHKSIDRKPFTILLANTTVLLDDHLGGSLRVPVDPLGPLEVETTVKNTNQHQRAIHGDHAARERFTHDLHHRDLHPEPDFA